MKGGEVEWVKRIEPNKHQIPRFLGEYSYHTDHSANRKRPNSLPMANVMWCAGFFGSVNFGISGESGRTVGLR